MASPLPLRKKAVNTGDNPPSIDIPEPPQTTISGGRGKGPKPASTAGKQAEEIPDRSEIADGYWTVFQILSQLFRADTEFEPGEFNDIAKQSERLAKRIPVVGVLFRLLGPLSLAGRILMKGRKLADGIARRRQRETADKSNEAFYGTAGGAAAVAGASQANNINPHPPQL